jgi:hypothetical protein
LEGRVFRTWLRIATDTMLLALEAQRVIALRTAAMTAGGARAQAEMERMVIEKVRASVRVGAMLTAGKSQQSIVRHYRTRVRANERRLSKR